MNFHSDNEDDHEGGDSDADPTVQFRDISSVLSDCDIDALSQFTICSTTQLSTDNTSDTVNNTTHPSQPSTQVPSTGSISDIS